LNDNLEDQEQGRTFVAKQVLSTGTWENNPILEGNIRNTYKDPNIAWTGIKYYDLVAFEGEFDTIDTIDNELSITFSLKASTYVPGFFMLWDYDADDWYTISDYETSTKDTFSLSTTEDTSSRWVEDGIVKFRIEAGLEETVEAGFIYQVSSISIFEANIKKYLYITDPVSDSENPDTDNDGLNDWEEYYPGGDGYITNALCNDTDADGLLDSAESVSLHKEYGKRERMTRVKVFGDWAEVLEWHPIIPDNPLIYEESTQQEFHFDAVFNSGTARNATVFVGFSSQTDLIINLVKIDVAGITVVEEENPDLDEPEGGIDGTYFFRGYDITQETTIFTGEWHLTINAEPEEGYSKDEYSLLLEEFKADVVLPLDPTDPDWDLDGIPDGHEMNASVSGWITNPRAWDSDADTWSDSDEINLHNTNPFSKDTKYSY